MHIYKICAYVHIYNTHTHIYTYVHIPYVLIHICAVRGRSLRRTSQRASDVYRRAESKSHGQRGGEGGHPLSAARCKTELPCTSKASLRIAGLRPIISLTSFSLPSFTFDSRFLTCAPRGTRVCRAQRIMPFSAPTVPTAADIVRAVGARRPRGPSSRKTGAREPRALAAHPAPPPRRLCPPKAVLSQHWS